MPGILNLFIGLFFSAFSKVEMAPISTIHPFHVSVIEINHNVTDKSLEISCKIFTDDLESTLATRFKTKVDLTNPSSKSAMDTLIKRYLQDHLLIKSGAKVFKPTYIGYEVDKEAVFCYLEIDGVSAPLTNLTVNSSVLYDKYEDQINIVHAITPAGRKSLKLNNPDNAAVFSW